jgi:NAD(P)-dependent dehydrogenase (short-subunit alcohol dehydrogenase family)
MVCRSPARGEAAADEIRAASGNPHVDLLIADLSCMAEVRHLAESFKVKYPQLHVLINNAGTALTRRTLTQEGFETVFAVNYLAPFLLTNLLLDSLKAGAPVRVINVAGDYHRRATIQFDDLMPEKEYSGFRANNQAKLALILFTYELARRLEGTGVTVNCLHPGAVATEAPLKDPHLPATSRFLYRLVKLFFQNVEQGAETSLFLAASPEIEKTTGKYFIKKKAVKSSPESYDEAVARRLWEVSSGLTGMNAWSGG